MDDLRATRDPGRVRTLGSPIAGVAVLELASHMKSWNLAVEFPLRLVGTGLSATEMIDGINEVRLVLPR